MRKRERSSWTGAHMPDVTAVTPARGTHSPGAAARTTPANP